MSLRSLQAAAPASPPSPGGYNPALGVLSNGLLTPGDVQTSFLLVASRGSTALVAGGLATRRLLSIYERQLTLRRTPEVSLSLLVYVFNELVVNYNFDKSPSISVLEKKLTALGYPIGARALELHGVRSALLLDAHRRFTRVIDVLQHIHTPLWTMLFGKPADNLEKSQDNADEYMVIDNDPLFTRYAVPPKEFDQLNCNAFVAGIVEGVLDAAYFPCSVTAHTVATEGHPMRSVYLIKFDPVVLQREHIRMD